MRTPPSSNLSTPCSTSSPPVDSMPFSVVSFTRKGDHSSRKMDNRTPNETLKGQNPLLPQFLIVHSCSFTSVAPVLSKSCSKSSPQMAKPASASTSPTTQSRRRSGFSIFARKDKDANAEEKEDKTYEVSLGLAVVVKKFVGNMLVKIKKPPSNHMCYAFTTLPQMEISIEPVVSDSRVVIPRDLRRPMASAEPREISP
ncbi:hypothetical protein M422DRAFT_29367 [Sphaerobolus stellatus SS14]|uniref:Uncharacterized protein n=1 Tax=Sphaerobolus stellatus (strain SS14) TaxID=990650 RepID=A0A0C9W4C5_SPHS4|nr:hypothetical protein M422DRAFT_29367 [Sphaerobolus stellatus SS14]